MTMRTVCDRCGSVCADEENVATLSFDLARFGAELEDDESTPIMSGEMDLCDACVKVVVGVVEKRILIEHSNQSAIVKAEDPAPAPKKARAPRKPKVEEPAQVPVPVAPATPEAIEPEPPVEPTPEPEVPTCNPPEDHYEQVEVSDDDLAAAFDAAMADDDEVEDIVQID